jgi:hypothetical protein
MRPIQSNGGISIFPERLAKTDQQPTLGAEAEIECPRLLAKRPKSRRLAGPKDKTRKQENCADHSHKVLAEMKKSLLLLPP